MWRPFHPWLIWDRLVSQPPGLPGSPRLIRRTERPDRPPRSDPPTQTRLTFSLMSWWDSPSTFRRSECPSKTHSQPMPREKYGSQRSWRSESFATAFCFNVERNPRSEAMKHDQSQFQATETARRVKKLTTRGAFKWPQTNARRTKPPRKRLL